jgi:tetratricopeptide (TPR) repeat protein
MVRWVCSRSRSSAPDAAAAHRGFAWPHDVWFVGVSHCIVLALTLVTGVEPSWKPAPAPPPTAWARAGARGWTLCEDLERKAIGQQTHASGRNQSMPGADEPWAKHASKCPHVPAVLLQAAQEVLGDTAALDPEAPDPQPMFQAHRKRTQRALGWIDAALAEAQRRAAPVPPQALYYRAYALVGLGRHAEAAKALTEAVRVGDVERWRSDRMFAIIEVMRGDLVRALESAHRGVNDAPFQDRLISRYILAFVLDRVGASDEASLELRALRREAGHASHRRAVESLLPMHERVYLRALDHQASGEKSNALRLWNTYLARPEPAEPDKELARRHLGELEPAPAPVGGPGSGGL